VPLLCSGCPAERPNHADVAIRLHHVHLNVRDVRETVGFYEKFFGAREVWLNDHETALWADPILLLLDEADGDLPDALETGLEHVGLGVADPVTWFDDASREGLEIDTRNGAPTAPVSMPLPVQLSPFVDPNLDTFAYVYVRGPNHERIEVWSGLDRFRHVHFLSREVDKTVAWYGQLLNATPLVASAADTFGLGNGLPLAGGVQLFYASAPTTGELVPTDDLPVSHIAFSVTDLDAMLARCEQLSLELVTSITRTEHGFRSFFLRGPEHVLIELVEAQPIAAP
jgi:catechol 2,3-dioxygenase-like lactoylglutathione lyase family enzyme